jgi:hypothetical protein
MNYSVNSPASNSEDLLTAWLPATLKVSMDQVAAAGVPGVVIFDFKGEFGNPKPEDLKAGAIQDRPTSTLHARVQTVIFGGSWHRLELALQAERKSYLRRGSRRTFVLSKGLRFGSPSI